MIQVFAVDIGPLRSYRDFRLLWVGELISQTGHQITVVAVFYQVYGLTESPAAVGLVGLVHLIPLIVTSIGGGVIVDTFDRRKMLLLSQIGFATSSSILLFGALAGEPPLVLVYGPVALTAALSGIASPTRASMTPNLVKRNELPAASALNQAMFSATMIVGPAVGGVIIARAGLAWAYGVDVATYGAAVVAVLMMRPMRPDLGEGARPSGLAAVREGFAYLKGRRVLQSTFTVDLVAMIFGMPRALFPIIAVTQFGRGPEAVGILFSSIAVGALVGAATAGWVGRIHYQGRAVLVAVAVWGAGITAFGLSGNRLLLALVFLAIAGAADVISAVFRNTILQLNVPDSLRGRMSAVHILVVTGGPRLGDLEAGLMAQVLGPTFAVVSGGLACIVGVGILAVLVPQFTRYRSEHAGRLDQL